jgi:hypothetical protein
MVAGRPTFSEAERLLIREAALLADRAMIFDVSALNKRPVVLLEQAQGQVVRRTGAVPEWFEGLYGDLV